MGILINVLFIIGWAMSQFLPVGDFRWEDSESVTQEAIMQMREDSQEGLILEV